MIDWFWFLMGMTFSFIFELVVGIFVTARVVQYYLTKNASKILNAIIENMSDEDKKRIRQWALGLFGFSGGRPQKFSLMGLASQFLPMLFGQQPPQAPPTQ